MNIPKLKKLRVRKYHGSCVLSDNYSWVDQKDILEVLKDPKNFFQMLRNILKRIIL